MNGSEDIPNPYEGYDEFDEEISSDEDMEMEEYFLDNTCEDSIFTCDTCDRDFPSQNIFNRICGIDGCTFTAHEKVIEKHIRMQHSTGLYDKIRNLNTPEDIARWVEERKARYPTKENVDKRYKQQEELLRSGVKIGERNNRFGKDKTRLERMDPQTRQRERDKFFKKKNDKIKKEVKKYQPKSLIVDKADWNGNMFPFGGTKELFDEDEESKISDFDDEEWDEKPSNIKSFVKVNASLGALMGAYGSDFSEEETEEIQPEKEKSINQSKEGEQKQIDISENTVKDNTKCENELVHIGSDDEAPLEVKIEKVNPFTEAKDCTNQTKEKLTVKGRNRKRKATKYKKREDSVDFKRRKVSNDRFPYKNFRKRRITLLEKLLDSEIRRERNILLQCVKYIVDNGFFMSETSVSRETL